MTKLDTPLGYVHCKEIEPIRKALDTYQKEVTFRGLPGQGSDNEIDSGRSTGHSECCSSSASSRHSTELDAATSDEFFHKMTSENNRINSSNAVELDELDACVDCKKLNLEKSPAETESSFLQGNRCKKHSDLMKTSAILNHSSQKVSSPTREPLSNYDRKRTPSGGSVMKHIQAVVITQEEEVKAAYRACDGTWKIYIGMAVLFLANLLNYMDRYTIAGVYLKMSFFRVFFSLSMVLGHLFLAHFRRYFIFETL
jgi:hypothetical protein